MVPFRKPFKKNVFDSEIKRWQQIYLPLSDVRSVISSSSGELRCELSIPRAVFVYLAQRQLAINPTLLVLLLKRFAERRHRQIRHR